MPSQFSSQFDVRLDSWSRCVPGVSLTRAHCLRRLGTMASQDLTLPPKVTGKLHGYLTIKVDEVLWARKHPGEVSAVVNWWGGDRPITFSPCDITHTRTSGRNCTAVYEIHTCKELFEDYLKKCKTLKIAMADKFGMPIGCVSVPNLCQMISSTRYDGYYPIINSFGNRIGDLHVSFSLRMSLPSSDGSKAVKGNPVGKNTKPPALIENRLAVPRLRTKQEKTKKNEEMSDHSKREVLKYEESQLLLDSHTRKETGAKCEPVQSAQMTVPTVPPVKDGYSDIIGSKKRDSPTDNMISQILQHGKKIRDAMTASVIDDADGNILSVNKAPLPQMPMKFYDCFGTCDLKSQIDLQLKESTCSLTNKKNEKVVIDFLSGKPLTESEEKEALEALRSMTPTKDILEKVSYVAGEAAKVSKECAEPEKDICEESEDEIVLNITDYRNPSNSAKADSSPVDGKLLSEINCIRITIHSVVLNSAGLKRIGAASQRRRSVNSTSVQPPPGVTYFVEYQFPQPPGSRPWASDVVRYCSKRHVGCEINFGDRSSHNLPTSSRSSLSEKSSLMSMMQSLSFKVCARHLNQRVPITLGCATPTELAPLLASQHLRQDFDLQITAFDNLPVGQLKICLELGRDRVHFGGLFDPGEPLKKKEILKENNSLGIASPSSSCSKFGVKSSSKSKSPATRGLKNVGTQRTVVTRAVPQSKRSGEINWADESSALRAAQASRVVDQLAASAGKKRKPTLSASVSSTETSKIQQLSNKRPPSRNLMPPLQSSYDWKSAAPTNKQFIKHEMALTIEQIKGCNPLAEHATQDKDCFVTYKFPNWNASKESSVEWQSFSTEPTVCLKDTWFRNQSQVHCAVLPEDMVFHSFIKNAVTIRGTAASGNSTISFSICVRHYVQPVEDILVAQAFLPLASLVTLEEAFKEAVRSNPKFSESSCASVVVDLPLHVSPLFRLHEDSSRGQLRVKIDYRHLPTNRLPAVKSVSKNQGDSVQECGRYSSAEEELWLNVSGKAVPPSLRTPDPQGDVALHQGKISPIPNWALSPDKRLPPRQRAFITESYNKYMSNGMKKWGAPRHAGVFNRPEATSHASWESLPSGRKIEAYSQSIPSRKQSSKYSSKAYHSPHRSMVDLLQVPEYEPPSQQSTSCKTRNEEDEHQLRRMHYMSHSCQNLYSEVKEPFFAPKHSMNRYFDAATSTSPMVSSRHIATGISLENVSMEKNSNYPCKKSAQPLQQHVSTNTEEIPLQKSKSQQITVDLSARSCQTSPRSNENVYEKELGLPVPERDLIDLSSDTLGLKPDQKSSTESKVLPKCTIDDFEVLEIDSKANSFKSKPAFKNSQPYHIDKPLEEVENVPEVLEKKSEDTGPVSDVTDVVTVGSTADSSSVRSYFKAKVGVECALHLWSSQIPGSCGDSVSTVFVFVSFHCSEAPFPNEQAGMVQDGIGNYSPAVVNTGDPKWNWNCEAQLPIDLLVLAEKRLLFKVWQSDKVPSDMQYDTYDLVGFAAVDLTVLTAGLPLISGWYNVMDFAGSCRGQIKLIVEPLEDIQRLVEKSCVKQPQSQLASAASEQTPTPASSSAVYVAHCAYPDFPSHVVQHTDMRVHKMDSQTSEQALSEVISSYQALLQYCQQKSSELPLPLPTCSASSKYTGIPIQLKEDESQTNRTAGSTPSPPENISEAKELKEILPAATQSSLVSADLASQADPSVCLREKLSELEMLTKSLKDKLVTDVKSAHSSKTAFANYGLPSDGIVYDKAGSSHENTSVDNLDERKETKTDCGCKTCTCNQSVNLGTKQRLDKRHIRSRFDRKSDASNSPHQASRHLSSAIPVRGRGCDRAKSWGHTLKSHTEQESGSEKTQVSQIPPKIDEKKSRRTWDKQEELVDLSAIGSNESQRDEHFVELEDVAEWLSDSAMQHVFNPVLFCDLINSMSPTPSAHGVRLIELNDSSDDTDIHPRGSPSPSSHTPAGDDAGQECGTSQQKESGKGDETYRKNTLPNLNDNRLPHSCTRVGGSLIGDTDSGVDVDGPAIHHGRSLGSWDAFQDPSWVSAGRLARQTSASSSLGSTQNPCSTGPSSLSASVSVTPAGSPQRRRQPCVTQCFSHNNQ